MKNVFKIIITFVVSILYIGCENADPGFDDFDYTTVYFPFQYPVRTLVLGDYVYDNSNDKQGKFIISARVGGLRQNKENVQIKYRLADEFVENLTFPNGNEIKLLPTDYFTLKGLGGIDFETTVLPDSFRGEIEVQLTDAFFNDPLSVSNNYVIPLQIVETSADSILSGSSELENPNRFIPSDWAYMPKDFTLFGVKYVNPYHGVYLHSGSATTFNASNEAIGTINSTAEYVEQRELWELKTHDLTSINTTNPVLKIGGSPGNYTMNIQFDDETGDVFISKGLGSPYDVNGAGKYVKDGGSWGGKPRDAMFLEYDIIVGNETVKVLDTLLFRDKGVGFEEFLPTVVP